MPQRKYLVSAWSYWHISEKARNNTKKENLGTNKLWILHTFVSSQTVAVNSSSNCNCFSCQSPQSLCSYPGGSPQPWKVFGHWTPGKEPARTLTTFCTWRGHLLLSPVRLTPVTRWWEVPGISLHSWGFFSSRGAPVSDGSRQLWLEPLGHLCIVLFSTPRNGKHYSLGHGAAQVHTDSLISNHTWANKSSWDLLASAWAVWKRLAHI